MKTGDPIRKEMAYPDLDYRLAPFERLTRIRVDSERGPVPVFAEKEENGLLGLDSLLIDQPKGGIDFLDESIAPGVTPDGIEELEGSIKSEDNICYKNKDKHEGRFNLLKWAKWLIYENPFMERLFPSIK